MATISFEIPDGQRARVVDAFAGMFGWQSKVASPNGSGGIDNPENKQAFARRKIAEYVRDVVVTYEAANAAESARKSATDKAVSEISIK